MYGNILSCKQYLQYVTNFQGNVHVHALGTCTAHAQ